MLNTNAIAPVLKASTQSTTQKPLGVGASQASLKPLVEDLLEDPISGKKMFEPVLAADGRIYDKKTLEKWRKKSPDGILRSPFTRQPMPKPQPVPQLQALAKSLYADEIAAATLRRRQIAGLMPPPMPQIKPFDLGALSPAEADAIVAQQRRGKDGVLDMARIDAALLFNVGLVRRGKHADAVITFLKEAGCLDPNTQHIDAAADAYRMEQALSHRVGPWYSGAGHISQNEREKLISAFRLIAVEQGRLAPLKVCFDRTLKLLNRAEALQLTPAIAPLKKQAGTVLSEMLKKPSQIGVDKKA